MFDEIKKNIAGVQQPRTMFQLQKFVIGQHPVPEMQYYQVLLELQDTMYKYELALLNVRKTHIKLQNLDLSNDELDKIEAEELRLGLEQTQLALLGAEREMSCLLEIYHSFEHKFSKDEIDKAQPEYWKQRLTNNANAMLMGGASVNPAHIEAMGQAGILDVFVEQVIEAKREVL